MVGPTSTVAEALPLANDPTLDAALLDVNLGSETSWPIAAVLKTIGVPIVFAIGYDSKTVLPDDFQQMPVIGKPFRLEDVAERLRAVMQERAPATDPFLKHAAAVAPAG